MSAAYLGVYIDPSEPTRLKMALMPLPTSVQNMSSRSGSGPHGFTLAWQQRVTDASVLWPYLRETLPAVFSDGESKTWSAPLDTVLEVLRPVTSRGRMLPADFFQDYREVFIHLLVGVLAGDAQSEVEAARIARLGVLGTPADSKLAGKLYAQAACRGDWFAFAELAEVHWEQGNDKEAAECWTSFFEQAAREAHDDHAARLRVQRMAPQVLLWSDGHRWSASDHMYRDIPAALIKPFVEDIENGALSFLAKCPSSFRNEAKGIVEYAIQDLKHPF